MRALHLLADEALVEGSRMAVAATGGRGEVAVAHPVSGGDRGDDRAETIEIHRGAPFGGCLRPIKAHEPTVLPCCYAIGTVLARFRARSRRSAADQVSDCW